MKFLYLNENGKNKLITVNPFTLNDELAFFIPFGCQTSKEACDV